MNTESVPSLQKADMKNTQGKYDKWTQEPTERVINVQNCNNLSKKKNE